MYSFLPSQQISSLWWFPWVPIGWRQPLCCPRTQVRPWIQLHTRPRSVTEFLQKRINLFSCEYFSFLSWIILPSFSCLEKYSSLGGKQFYLEENILGGIYYHLGEKYFHSFLSISPWAPRTTPRCARPQRHWCGSCPCGRAFSAWVRAHSESGSLKMVPFG